MPLCFFFRFEFHFQEINHAKILAAMPLKWIAKAHIFLKYG